MTPPPPQDHIEEEFEVKIKEEDKLEMEKQVDVRISEWVDRTGATPIMSVTQAQNTYPIAVMPLEWMKLWVLLCSSVLHWAL